MKQAAATCFVHEDGKLLQLPANARATDLCAVTIGGWVRDVIVVGPHGPHGEEMAVPDRIVAIVDEWGWLR